MKRKMYWWLLLLPFVLFYLGGGLNYLVLTANYGTFPVILPWLEMQKLGVEPGSLIDVQHIAMTPQMHLKWLADWIQYDNMVVSPGDCLIYLGMWLKIPCISSWLTLLWKHSQE